MKKAIWSIPAERMKMKKPHVVPLSEPAIKIIKTLHFYRAANKTNLVFENVRNNRPFSVNAPKQLLKRMGKGEFTTHGMRASFKTRMTEATNHDRNAIEMCLAHAIGSQTERAYQRGDLFTKRKEIMDDWAAYLGGKSDSQIIAINRRTNSI